MKKKLREVTDELYQKISGDEKALVDYMLDSVKEYGKIQSQGSSINAGYENARNNPNLEIGVKCGNCVFHMGEGDNIDCSIVEEEIEENGACRFAAIPPGVVKSPDSMAEASDNPARPAPKKDQRKGSDKNKPGSASSSSGKITVSPATKKALENKVSAHNESMKSANKPSWSRASYGALAAVYRRGAGAYSSSFRPGISRPAWAMARVNAFLFLLRNGSPKNPKYVTDYDLLPSGHPKKSDKKAEAYLDNFTAQDIFSEAGENTYKVPSGVSSAAKRALKWISEGKAGDGFTSVGRRRAAQLASGGTVSRDTAARMKSYFARHNVDKKATGFNSGQEGYPSPGRVAWDAWGGTAGQAWVNRINLDAND